MAQIMAGVAVPLQGRAYHAMNECIQLLINNYVNNNIMDFLRGISHNLA